MTTLVLILLIITWQPERILVSFLETNISTMSAPLLRVHLVSSQDRWMQSKTAGCQFIPDGVFHMKNKHYRT